MKVFSYSKWQYDIMQDRDIMTCSTCGDKAGVTYVLANTEEEIDSLIDTTLGQQCCSCLAMFLSSRRLDVMLPTILKRVG